MNSHFTTENGVHFLSKDGVKGNTTDVIYKNRRFLMKKIAMLATGLALSLSLCACACTNNAPATDPKGTTGSTTNTGTNQKPMPTDTMTIPVPETNIPDPSVDTSMPGGIPNGTNGGAVS